MNALQVITDASDLVTSREQTRAGFIAFALEKNRKASPLVMEAKSLNAIAKRAATPADLLNIPEIHQGLLTAAGLSDKALNYFTIEDEEEAIKRLIKEFLEPEGEYFVDALVYRYLLIKGDALGGSMRNYVGAVAQQKLIRTLISNLTIMGLGFEWFDIETKKWKMGNSSFQIEDRVKALHWKYEGKERIIAFNLKVPVVDKNVDINLFDASITEYDNGKIVKLNDKFIMLGELKGGIDPAGADEHWKTGNSAIDRIRKAFSKVNIPVKTSFVGAAIAKNMADELYGQLLSHELSFAANLTVDEQLVNYCDWVIKL